MLTFRTAALPAIVIFLLCVGIGLTFVLPVYTDEVAYKIFLERYFITGGFRQGVAPFCEGAFLVAPSLLLLPGAVFWSVISKFGGSYLSYRMLPCLALAASCFAIAVINIRKENKTFWPLLLLVTFGPPLYSLVLLRPEIFILCSCLALYMLGQSMLACEKTWLLFLKAFGALLIFSICIYLHPKALYVLALLCGVIFLPMRNVRGCWHKIIYGVLFLSLTIALTAQALSFHSKEFIECRTAPSVQKLVEANMALQAVNPLDLLFNRGRFINNLQLGLDDEAFNRMSRGLSYANSYDASFLPPGELDDLGAFANFIIKCVALFFALYIAIKTCACLIFLKNPDERRQFYLTGLAVLSLALPFFFNITRHFYEEAYLFGALTVMAGLVWPFRVAPFGLYALYGTRTLTTIMILVSILCLSISGIRFTPAFLRGYEGRSISYRTDRKHIDEMIHRALSQLSISEEEPLIVDDLTYDALRNHRFVLPITAWNFITGVPGAVSHYSFEYGAHYGVARCKDVEGTFTNRVPYVMKAMIANTKFSDEGTPVENNICVFELR